MRRYSPTANTKLVFCQGKNNEKYIIHLYELFKEFISQEIKYTVVGKEGEKGNKPRIQIKFATLSLPCFNYYYELFYQNKKKIIPKEILGLLTIISLSFWIMEGFRLLILYSLNEYGPEYIYYLSGIPCIGVNYAGKVTPEISYLNADKDKKEIYNENKKKSGVYC